MYLLSLFLKIRLTTSRGRYTVCLRINHTIATARGFCATDSVLRRCCWRTPVPEKGKAFAVYSTERLWSFSDALKYVCVRRASRRTSTSALRVSVQHPRRRAVFVASSSCAPPRLPVRLYRANFCRSSLFVQCLVSFSLYTNNF